MGINWQKYKGLDAWFHHNYYFHATVLYATVHWYRKHDGSNISLLFHKGFPLVYTHNQKAIPQVEVEVKGLLKPIMGNLKELLGERYIIYFELLRKGKSPAGYEIHEEPEILAFDMYDMDEQHWVNPEERDTLLDKYGIPRIPLFTTTVSTNVEAFVKTIDDMVETAKEKGWEGFVAKWWYDEDMYAIKVKVEHKYPKKLKPKKRGKPDPRPELELSEVTGAIDKVFNEIGIRVHTGAGLVLDYPDPYLNITSTQSL